MVMKTVFLGTVTALLLSTAAFGAAECPVTSEKANNLRDRGTSYKAPTPPTSSAGSGQANPQGTAQANANAGIAAANQCLSQGGKIKSDIEKELEKTKGKTECSSQEEKLKEGKNAIDGTLSQCQATLSQLQNQAGKTGDNKDKMGGGDQKKDGKGDDKGGGGGAPQMPQPPPKKEEKKEDLAAKERERQAKIKECKARVQNALEIKQKNCEYKYPYNEAMPIADQKQKQDECKQTEIFASQAETSKCEYDHAFSPSSSLTYSPSSSSTKTNTSTVTAPPTSTATHTSTLTQ